MGTVHAVFSTHRRGQLSQLSRCIITGTVTAQQMIVLYALDLLNAILGTRHRFRRAVVIIILVIILVLVTRMPMPTEWPALPPLPTLPPEYFGQVF